MRFEVLTIFPEVFPGPLGVGVVGRALERGDIELRVHDLRDYTTDRHRQVDDVAFGGQGPGRQIEAHLRTFWLCPCVRACPVHGVVLETAHGGLAEIPRWAVAGSREPAAR